MIPQLATSSALRVGMNVPLTEALPGVSQFLLLSRLSVLMVVVGEEGQGVAGLELGGLELELSLDWSPGSARGLLRAACSGERVLVWRKEAVLERDWDRMGDMLEFPLRPPVTEEILGENTEASSSSGPSSVRGRPRFFFISPLRLTKPEKV